VKFKKGDTVIYPQHGACLVQGTKKVVAFGETQEYLILRTIINEMTLSVPVAREAELGHAVEQVVHRVADHRPGRLGHQVRRQSGDDLLELLPVLAPLDGVDVGADELEDLVSVLSKADPRVPSNWSRRFKNHQEKLKSGDVYQVAEVVRNLAARNRDASLSAAERTMYERARINLISEIAPALKVSAEEAEHYLDEALAKGVLKPAKEIKKKA